MKIAIRPLTLARWADLESVFNARGCSVARSCWCMYYRLSGVPSYASNRSRVRAYRARLRALVAAGRTPGLLAYRGRTPVGWVSLGPRGEYRKLARSPVLYPVDDMPVWSIICFVVPAEYRHQGIARALLQGAIAFARRQGARLLEAYPVDRRARSKDDTMWFGSKSMFDAAGFAEVARRKPERPIVRRAMRPGISAAPAASRAPRRSAVRSR